MSGRDIISFNLNGTTCDAVVGETILQVAKRSGVDIPHLCYKDGYRADGNCRACVVEIKGERTLAPSCCRAPTVGMDVQTHSDRALKSQKMVVEMLLSDMPDVATNGTTLAKTSPTLTQASMANSACGPTSWMCKYAPNCAPYAASNLRPTYRTLPWTST